MNTCLSLQSVCEDVQRHTLDFTLLVLYGSAAPKQNDCSEVKSIGLIEAMGKQGQVLFFPKHLLYSDNSRKIYHLKKNASGGDTGFN